MSWNKVELIGNVGMIQLKEFDNGGAILNISLATTERGFTTKDGRKIDEKTDWHNVVFRNHIAKVVSKYVKKGDKLFVSGKLKNRQYEKDGVTKTITEVIADSAEFMMAKNPTTASEYDDDGKIYTKTTITEGGDVDLSFLQDPPF